MTQQESFLHRLDALPGSVLLTDASSRVLYANKALESRNGFAPSEVFEKRPADAWGRKMTQGYYKWFWNRLQSASQLQTTIKNRHANGDLFTETLHLIPLSTGDAKYYLELQPSTTDKDSFEKNFQSAPLRSFEAFEKLFADYFVELPALKSHRDFISLLAHSMKEKHRGRLEDRLTIEHAENRTQAFSELYMRYQPEILLYFASRMTSAQAQEASQDVFLKAWRGFSAYQPQASYRTYLQRIAHNHFIDHLRKKQILLDEFADLPVQPQGVHRMEYHLAMDQLNAHERQLLISYYLEGYKLREIADQLQTTENAIKLRLSRLRRRMRGQQRDVNQV